MRLFMSLQPLRPLTAMASFTPELTVAYFLAFTLIILTCLQVLRTSIKSATDLRSTIRRYRKQAQGFRYLIAGPQIIDDAYSKADGKSFRVSTPSNDHILVTSNILIRELINMPLDSLSLHAVATEMLQPKYTMSGFEWQQQRGIEGTGFVRALRSLLTSHLPYFRADLENAIRQTLREELSKPEKDGYSRVNLFPMIKRIVTKVNCLIFFGGDLSRNEEFTAAALEFPQVVILTAECMRITPKFLRRLVASLVSRRHSAAKTLCRFLEPIVRERLENRSKRDNSNPVQVDCVQWLIDTSPRKNPWSPGRMMGEIIAVWFSSVHQLAMTATYAVEDLCLHEEFVGPLRQEIRKHLAEEAKAPVDLEGLPLLDSFIKESIRCSNVDAISCRRKALRDVILHDGSIAKKGDWVCIPQRAMMHDPSRYANPEVFDGRRFARANTTLLGGQLTHLIPDKEPSHLTTASIEWPIWGLGNAACPGRFYASVIMKMIVTQILLEWECKMADISSSRTIVWRSSVVPREGTVVMFRNQLP
ncbi:cytochrome P450 [Nemania sp. FL0031]|nr:cytochrome P450 [Nemania sp. FL0031]